MADARPALGALVILTASDEGVAADPELRADLETLLELPGASRIELGALDPASSRQLVRDLLGLRGEAAALVEERSAGSPLYAVSVVGDWVARGVLVPTEHGFALRGPAPPLPPDLSAAWRERVDAVLRDRADADGQALELAAVLGVEVDGDEHAAVLASAELHPSGDLISDLARQQLVVPTARGWRFAHVMLVEALRARAREAGRLRRHHASAGAVVADPARRGAHLLAAGRAEEALPLLVEGARASRLRAAYTPALTALERATRAAEGLDPLDPVRGQIAAECVATLFGQGRNAEARTEVEAVLPSASGPGWERPRAELLSAYAQILRNAGEVDRAAAVAAEALAGFRALQDAHGAATAELELAWCDQWRNRPGAARERLQALLDTELSITDRAHALYGLVAACDALGDHSAMRRWVERATEAYRASGGRLGEASCISLLGVVLVHEGRLDEAAAAYRRAVAMEAALGSSMEEIDRMNLARTELLRRKPQAALDAVAPSDRAQGRDFIRAVRALLRAAAHAQRSDLTSWEAEMGTAEALFARFSAGDLQTAELAEQMAAELGGRPEAARAWALAQAQWRAIGDTERAERAREAQGGATITTTLSE